MGNIKCHVLIHRANLKSHSRVMLEICKAFKIAWPFELNPHFTLHLLLTYSPDEATQIFLTPSCGQDHQLIYSKKNAVLVIFALRIQICTLSFSRHILSQMSQMTQWIFQTVGNEHCPKCITVLLWFWAPLTCQPLLPYVHIDTNELFPQRHKSHVSSHLCFMFVMKNDPFRTASKSWYSLGWIKIHHQIYKLQVSMGYEVYVLQIL